MALTDREENDLLRRYMKNGTVLLKGGIAARSDLAEILQKVRTSEPEPATNMFGQNSFGSFEHLGDLFCWKIEKTLSLEDINFQRVLTVMLADQY